MRAVTKGDIIQRDRLLTYTIGEFYNEMSLFIEEKEREQKAIEEMKKKK